MSAPIPVRPFNGRVGEYKGLNWPVSPGWCDARVSALKRMWADGLSATQIARTLGCVSRNGVIGKVHRMGMAGRAKASAPLTRRKAAAPTRPVGAPASPPRPNPRTPPPVAAPIPVREPALATAGGGMVGGVKPGVPPRREAFLPLAGSQPRPFVERPARGCRWPIGEENLSCCLQVEHDGPYCPTHKALAYAVPVVRRTPNELMRSVRRYV